MFGGRISRSPAFTGTFLPCAKRQNKELSDRRVAISPNRALFGMADKPALKHIDDVLYQHASHDVIKLNKQARAEKRLAARRQWKDENDRRRLAGLGRQQY